VTAKVIDIADRDAPWLTGDAVCGACAHYCVVVKPASAPAQSQCPRCRRMSLQLIDNDTWGSPQ
jgi:hypothetical protein